MSLGLWEWTRVWALAGLALPVALLLFAAFAREEPLRQPTGLLDLWRELELTRPERSGRASRRRPSVALLLACLALAAASLAIAEPRRVNSATSSRQLVLVVDASPSMFLPLEPGSPTTRVESALSRARTWLAEVDPDPRAVEWRRVAGAGVLKSAPNKSAAIALIEFLLSEEAQVYFAEETFEYPLLPGVPPPADYIAPLDSLNVIEVDLSLLGDVEATVAMLQETGALP